MIKRTQDHRLAAFAEEVEAVRLNHSWEPREARDEIERALRRHYDVDDIPKLGTHARNRFDATPAGRAYNEAVASLGFADTNTTLENIGLDEISVPANRLRSLDPEKVASLAASIRENGLIAPIGVQKLGTDDEDDDDQPRYRLLHGRHRLEAMRQLGAETIPARVYPAAWTEDQTGLLEIDENLQRKELTPDERAKHLLARKAIWERLYPTGQSQAAHDAAPEIGYGKPPPQRIGFAAATAAATGLSKSQINRDLARASGATKPPAAPAPDADDEYAAWADCIVRNIPPEELSTFLTWLTDLDARKVVPLIKRRRFKVA